MPMPALALERAHGVIVGHNVHTRVANEAAAADNEQEWT
jgi:hypothetical protein